MIEDSLGEPSENCSPLVSVIIPNYNHLRFLPERINSVLDQTFQDFELILLDDCSHDGSREYLKSFAGYQNVRLHINEVNSGSPFHQWNKGVVEARGKYIWIAESDDLAEMELLARCVDVLERMPNVGIVSSNSLRIDEKGEIVGQLNHDAFESQSERWDHDFFSNGEKELRYYLYLQNTLPSASAIVFRKSVYLDAGYADTSFTISGDWMQWCKMLMIADLYHLSDPLSFSRMHSSNQRSLQSLNGRYELECLKVLDELNRRLPLSKIKKLESFNRYTTSYLQGLRHLRIRRDLTIQIQMVRLIAKLQFPSTIPFSISLVWTSLIALIKKRGRACEKQTADS